MRPWCCMVQAYLHSEDAILKTDGHYLVADLDSLLISFRSDKHVRHYQGIPEAYHVGRPQHFHASSYSPPLLGKAETVLAPAACIRVARAEGFASWDECG